MSEGVSHGRGTLEGVYSLAWGEYRKKMGIWNLVDAVDRKKRLINLKEKKTYGIYEQEGAWRRCASTNEKGHGVGVLDNMALTTERRKLERALPK